MKFPWHSEEGIIGNAKKLNIEFNETRNLKPVRIAVSGPPASGKTFYSKTISDYYNIPRVHIKELCDKAFKMAEVEEPEDEFIQEIKDKIEELKDAEVEKIEAAREGKDYGDEEPPEIDRSAIKVRLPS